MSKENPQKYQKKYPSSFPWEKQIWLLRVGDKLEKESGESFQVADVYRSPIRGKQPIVKLRKYE